MQLERISFDVPLLVTSTRLVQACASSYKLLVRAPPYAQYVLHYCIHTVQNSTVLHITYTAHVLVELRAELIPVLLLTCTSSYRPCTCTSCRTCSSDLNTRSRVSGRGVSSYAAAMPSDIPVSLCCAELTDRERMLSLCRCAASTLDCP